MESSDGSNPRKVRVGEHEIDDHVPPIEVLDPVGHREVNRDRQTCPRFEAVDHVSDLVWRFVGRRRQLQHSIRVRGVSATGSPQGTSGAIGLCRDICLLVVQA